MLRFGGWFGRLLYRLEWALNQRLLILPSHALCSRCRWAFHRSELTDGLCPGCDAWYAHKRHLEEEERRIQEETDAAWAEEKRRRREEDERAWREVQNRPGWL
ncbi:hypothetical protein COT70_02275 [candidate division WWE3 bacterium CG09_land_8_20_14_0_10_47_33]|uniref:Uncharacterized protein n=1 Tax=candidate division WWE3 bacterium CG_4_9_14_0_2_um_filter_48_10 TaxID=1975078 RepID=A0A2M8EK52_UNCKA|nr:MAG: hypothetical protein COT70_02275 [candidate division WWE3 bacterium CG09_land_8_20_14_0_10_47_33]PIZ41595.1 MAG: hypothetical protein COY35_00015 [candidate division WWE3 bacterium CG_4_10_14_0_2_um_filter_47_8]PJC23100.1 MAG: hypothetical protein CO059_00635 [candidate division WWE3 bacterium CG_4_9_14_0_2_um_filter_48_10]PJE51943.1 MAG: hypothetical protein COV28_01360 [candidate division WWE3 bacterium CG10_big_fil_rev_8_21_14_0_10_48_23]